MEQESCEVSAQVICGQVLARNYQSHCKLSMEIESRHLETFIAICRIILCLLKLIIKE